MSKRHSKAGLSATHGGRPKSKPYHPPTEPPSGSQDACAKEEELWNKVVASLDEDPAFQVLDFEGIHWLDPYTGQAVNAPFSWRDSALEHLSQTGDWKRRPPHPLPDMLMLRWRNYLGQHLNDQTRLRLFDGQNQWLNPLTGTWSATVRCPTDGIDQACLAAMATELATIPDSSPKTLLPADRLQMIQRERTLIDAPAQPKAQTPRSEPMVAVITHSHSRPKHDSPTPPKQLPRLQQSQSTHESMETASERNWSKAVQQKLLGSIPPIPGFEHALLYQPLQSVGGDFYEVRKLADGRFLIILGDVSGHGTSAALIVTSLLKTIRFLCRQQWTSLSDFLVEINHHIREDLLPGQFITCAVLLLDPNTATAEYVALGHHDSLLASASSQTTLHRLTTRGPGLGLLSDELLRSAINPSSIALHAGDTLMLFTDGIHESRSPRGSELGVWAVFGILVMSLQRSPTEIIHHFKRQIDLFTGGQQTDDLTILVLRHKGSDLT